MELTQVLFTDARGKVWEYRFLNNTMLWREIDPLGHNKRYYYGGTYEEGRFTNEGREYTGHYLHDGKYVYGGRHAVVKQANV